MSTRRLTTKQSIRHRANPCRRKRLGPSSGATSSPPSVNPVARWTTDSWEAFTDRVLLFCRRLLRSSPHLDPHDCCQDVMAVVLRRDFDRRFDPALAEFYPYVNGIARHICLRAIRNDYRRAEVLERFASTRRYPHRDPSHEAELNELGESLMSALNAMSTTERLAFPRVRDHAEGVRHIAADRGSKHYARESRCRRRLRGLLKGHR